MALEIQNLPRVFKFNEDDDEKPSLPDPNPLFSAEEVMSFYSSSYPELTTARVVGPSIQDGKAVYSFATNYGTKG